MVAGFIQKLADLFGPAPGAFGPPVIDASAPGDGWDGEKFLGGLGDSLDSLLGTNYWTLRARSGELFRENLFAEGLIRRLITNEINTGLHPEATPDEVSLGLAEASLGDWSEAVESRYALWARTPAVCDWQGEKTFGALQAQARFEALIEGDVLVVSRIHKRTQRPSVQLISGSTVCAAWDSKPLGANTIEEGVELDPERRHVAYWVRQADGTTKRLPAYGRNGRRLAWLVYGSRKRLNEVRGMPLLANVLQSLKEVDRYRDSAQRKAVINSILAMFIKKNSDKPGSLPYSGGAVRRESVDVPSTANSTGARRFNLAKMVPGLVVEELQLGEEPVLKGGEGTDTNYGVFEEAVLQGVAWSKEVPPEILRLSFSNNYTASMAAINEYKIYIHWVWQDWGDTLCSPIFVDWLVSEVLAGTIKAPGLLDAWRDDRQFDRFAAWTSCAWYGSIKPSTDPVKAAKGSQILVAEGWSTNAREARVNTGTKYSHNIKVLRRENEAKAEALRPLLELQKSLADTAGGMSEAVAAAIEEAVQNVLAN